MTLESKKLENFHLETANDFMFSYSFVVDTEVYCENSLNGSHVFIQHPRVVA